MYTGFLIPREDKCIPSIFFTLRILLKSFNESTVTSNFLKIVSEISS